MQKFKIHTLVLLIFILGAVEKAECLQSTGDGGGPACNATRVGDCLPDDEEFLMESETSRRILQGGNGGKTIGYQVFDPKRPNCNRNVYGSCIGKESKFYNGRPCNYLNTCGRSAK